MRFSLLDLDDGDTLWEIFQEFDSRYSFSLQGLAFCLVCTHRMTWPHQLLFLLLLMLFRLRVA